MDLFERRRSLLGGKGGNKKFFLYKAGWTGVKNCSINHYSKHYTFQSNCVSIGTSYYNGNFILENITNLNSYKKLCVTYFVNVSRCAILVGTNATNGGVYGDTIYGELTINQISTVEFNINNIWSILGMQIPQHSPNDSFQIYEIWLEK